MFKLLILLGTASIAASPTLVLTQVKKDTDKGIDELKDKLNNLLEESKKTPTEGKKDELIKDLENAINKGQEISSKPNPTKPELNEVIKDLESAINAIEGDKGNKPDLDTKRKLSKDLTNLDLGEIENNNPETILAMVISKNRSVFSNEIEVKYEDITSTTTKVSVKPDSRHYKLDSIVDVKFTTAEDTSLSGLKNKLDSLLEKAKNTSTEGKKDELIKDLENAINKGQEISSKPNPTKPELNEVIKDLESAINAIEVDKGNKPDLDTKRKLSKDLTNLDLGLLMYNKSETIIVAIVKNNRSLFKDEVEIKEENIHPTTAKVTVKSGSTHYKPTSTVEVNFITDSDTSTSGLRDRLNNLISQAKAINVEGKTDSSITRLDQAIENGERVWNNQTSSKEQLERAIHELEDAISNIEISGNKPLNRSLSEDLQITDLDKLENNKSETILSSIFKLNRSLVKDEVEIKEENIHPTTAKVTVKSGSTHYKHTSTVEVKFSFDIDLNDQSLDFKTGLELGQNTWESNKSNVIDTFISTNNKILSTSLKNDLEAIKYPTKTISLEPSKGRVENERWLIRAKNSSTNIRGSIDTNVNYGKNDATAVIAPNVVDFNNRKPTPIKIDNYAQLVGKKSEIKGEFQHLRNGANNWSKSVYFSFCDWQGNKSDEIKINDFGYFFIINNYPPMSQHKYRLKLTTRRNVINNGIKEEYFFITINTKDYK